MGVFYTGKPNVKALARRGDAYALAAAAGYQDLISAGGDTMVDRGAPVRKEAILALGRLGPECGTAAVRAALADPADEVRMAAIRVVAAREEATQLAAAVAWMPPAKDGQSRALAITALRELRRPECARTLAAALVDAPGDDSVTDDEAALLRLLVEAEAESEVAREAVAELLGALGDEREAVSARAQELLVRLAPFGTEALVSELKVGAAPHRAAAVLAQIKDTRALKPLIDGLLNRDPRVRAECARALGELRDPAAVEPLFQAARDSDHRVRSQGRWALDQLGTGGVSPIRPMTLEALPPPEARLPLTETVNGSSGKNGSSGDRAIHVDAEVQVDRAEAPRRPADLPGPSRCALVYRESRRHGEFEVILTESDGSHRSVARSPAFRRPRFGGLRRRGAARIAHELLVRRLEACGWWPVDSDGPWHEVGFVRRPTSGTRKVPAVVTVVREAGRARFVAEELDTYGNPTPRALSVPFRALRFLRVRPSKPARAALEQLVRRMEPDGWWVTAAGGKEWYAISFWRSIEESPEPSARS
jgi:HEAT repeat protein